MKKILGGILLALSGLAMPPVHAANLDIYSAGSLRSSLNEMIVRFKADTGVQFTPAYGPSGKLRKEIEQGRRPAVFASASVDHTEALYKEGLLKSSHILAQNSMCLLAAPGVTLHPGRLLEAMLRPDLRLATSTPKIDPAGDYTWALFHKADRLQPGAYAALDHKALKLLGQPAPKGVKPPSIGEVLTTARKADLFVIYCSEAAEVAHETPGVTYASFPASLDVPSYYGVGALKGADPAADQFVRYALSTQGQTILQKHGFKSVSTMARHPGTH